MQYRIIEKTMWDESKMYTPQYRYSFTPFWIDCKIMHQSGTLITQNFKTQEKAMDFIAEKISFYKSNKISSQKVIKF
jgi:hypothetical protein